MLLIQNQLSVSVLVPCFANTRHELGELIDDLASQTYQTFDIFFIYEVSSFDYDFEKVVQYCAKSNDFKNRIVCLPMEDNLGIGFALHTGVSRISSDIVIRADVGDRIRNDRFEKILKRFHEKDNDIIYSQAYLISANGSKLSSYPTNPQALSWSFSFRNPICHPTVAFRRKIVAKLGSYDKNLRFCEDLDLWLRMSKASLRFGCIDEPLVSYVMPQKARNKANWYANLIVRIKNFGSPNYIISFIGISLIAAYCIIPLVMKEKIYNVVRRKI